MKKLFVLTFFISILIDGEKMGVGKGKNKKEAEQAAAKEALEKLKEKTK